MTSRRNSPKAVLEKSKDLNACWEDISNILQESFKETVPMKEYKSSKKWMTEEILNLIRERRRAYESQNTMRYKGLDKQIKRELCKCKGKWEEYIAELYDDESSERPEIKKALEGRPITKDEIELALKIMKRGKATGQNEISVEL